MLVLLWDITVNPTALFSSGTATDRETGKRIKFIIRTGDAAALRTKLLQSKTDVIIELERWQYANSN